MGGVVTIAVKRGGLSMSGVGYKGMAQLANSMSLLRGEDVAWDALFAPEGQNDYLEELRQNSQAPVNYGIVCIDIDAKRVDSHQGYGAIGRVGMDARRDLLICLDHGILPHPLEDAGILLDAYMGGALSIKGGSAMVCGQTDPKLAANELIDRIQEVGDFQIFTALGIHPPGWEIVRWDNLGLPQGMFEMAQSLAAHGWPMGIDVLMGWKAHLGEEVEHPDEAARFEAWMESLLLSADLARHAGGRDLPSSPSIRV